MAGEFLRDIPAEFRPRIIQHATVLAARPDGVDASQAFRLALYDKDPEAYEVFTKRYPPLSERERQAVSRILRLPPEVVTGAIQAVVVAPSEL